MPSRHLTFPALPAATLAVFATLAAAQLLAVDAPRVVDVPELSGLAGRWSAALKTLDAPGFALAVVKDDAVVALDAFGVRNLAGEPATPDTCYYIASTTKPYTALAVCLLVGDGTLALDAPVKQYLPQLELSDAKLTATLSLRDLLCHRHGMEHGSINQLDSYTGEITDAIFFELLREAAIAHKVSYNNLHFTLAARVIEAVTGNTWQDFLDERLFTPTGMTRTTTSASELYGEGEHAEPMLLVDGEWVRSPVVKTNRTMHAAGGIGTTARDAARWLILNVNGGELDGRRILPEAIAREYYTQQAAFAKPKGIIRIEEGYALGWNVGKYRDPSRPYFFHGGGFLGASSYFCFLPKERIGVAVLSNSGQGGSDMAAVVSMDVLDRLLGVKDAPDILPLYVKAARERREKGGDAYPPGGNPAKAPGGLSQTPESYVGKYSHPREGVFEVLLERGALKAHNGDPPYVLISTAEDEFTACVVPGMDQTGAFELDSVGSVVAVLLASGRTTHRFERVGSKSKGGALQGVAASTYTGKYEAREAGYSFVLREENDKLIGHMTGPPPSPRQPELELLPAAGKHKFEVPSEGARFVFKVTDGHATGFTIHQSGETLEFKRVER